VYFPLHHINESQNFGMHHPLTTDSNTGHHGPVILSEGKYGNLAHWLLAPNM
jgi:hypothetical protein